MTAYGVRRNGMVLGVIHCQQQQQQQQQQQPVFKIPRRRNSSMQKSSAHKAYKYCTRTATQQYQQGRARPHKTTPRSELQSGASIVQYQV
jgi:hypothetical protein